MKINKYSISYSQTGYFKGLATCYNDGNEKLKPFYKYTPDIDSFKDVMEDKSKEFINRELLVRVISDQYLSSGLLDQENYSQITKVKIDSLASENTFTVTTGHQLCLFTGPLYFLYKIVSTINLSKKLKDKYPHRDFVPVFWMASEDHDFAEVNHVNLFGKKIAWESESEGPVGRMHTSTFIKLLEELEQIIGDHPNALRLMELFKTAYLNRENLSQSTRCLVHTLFSEYGLVIVDADDKRLKNEFVSLMSDDIFKGENELIVNNTISNLIESKLVARNKIQVHPRKINCYYLLDGLRERIEKLDHADLYQVKNTNITFSTLELKQHLLDYPERFSPNVVMRPLYQEKILPNLAYIGGPGELSYWFELRDFFELNKINFPVLISRNSLLWIDSSNFSKLNKLNLEFLDLFLPLGQLERKYTRQFSEIAFEKEKELINEAFDSLLTKAISIDNTLKTSVEGERIKQLKSIEMIENKILKAEKAKLEVSINQINKLKQRLFPNSGLQERHDNFIEFYLKYGDGFINTLIQNLDPFDNSFNIIAEQ